MQFLYENVTRENIWDKHHNDINSFYALLVKYIPKLLKKEIEKLNITW